MDITSVKQLLIQNDWTFISNNNDILLESKKFDNSPVSCFRASCIINSSASNLFNHIKSLNETDWKKLDNDITEWKILEQTNEYRTIAQVNKLPWPLWWRKGVNKLYEIENNGSYYMVGKSVDYNDMNKDASQYVIVNILQNIYAFEYIDTNKTKVYRLLHLDPCGNIPNVVIDASANKLCNLLNELKNKFN